MTSWLWQSKGKATSRGQCYSIETCTYGVSGGEGAAVGKTSPECSFPHQPCLLCSPASAGSNLYHICDYRTNHCHSDKTSIVNTHSGRTLHHLVMGCRKAGIQSVTATGCWTAVSVACVGIVSSCLRPWQSVDSPCCGCSLRGAESTEEGPNCASKESPGAAGSR